MFFWKLDSRDLEACCSQSIPLRVELHGLHSIFVQRALGGIVDASSRLPHDIDVFYKGMENVASPGCTILIDVFVVATSDVTTHAPKVIIFFSFVFILLKVSSSGHFATGESRNVKQFEGSPVRTWKPQISFLARPLGV